MKQGDTEKVGDFAHHFLDTQTELSKLISKIHYIAIAIYKELTFITACLLLSSSLMGTSLLSYYFWKHGNEIALRVKVLSSPTNSTRNGFSTITLPIFLNKPSVLLVNQLITSSIVQCIPPNAYLVPQEALRNDIV